MLTGSSRSKPKCFTCALEHLCDLCAESCHRLHGHCVGTATFSERHRHSLVCDCCKFASITGRCSKPRATTKTRGSLPKTLDASLQILPEVLFTAVENACLLYQKPTHGQRAFKDSAWRQKFREDMRSGSITLSTLECMISEHFGELIHCLNLDAHASECTTQLVDVVNRLSREQISSLLQPMLQRRSSWIKLNGGIVSPVHACAAAIMSIVPDIPSLFFYNTIEGKWGECVGQIGAALKRAAPKPISDEAYCPFHYVETPAALGALANRLARGDILEMALDLKGLHLHSIWMIQMTIRFSATSAGLDDGETKYVYADYLIDPVPLKHLIADALRPSLENPRIVKIMHTSSENIAWLQRDFNLFVVNLMDTSDGASLFGGRRNMHYLLDKYCGVKVSKESRVASWKERPLPSIVLKHSREDTHYLPFLYDALRAEVQLNATTCARGVSDLVAWFHLGRQRALKVANKEALGAQRHINPQ